MSMKRLFGEQLTVEFVLFKKRMERAIREQCSEQVVLEVHDAIYAPVRNALELVHGQVENAVSAALGTDLNTLPRHRHRSAITNLRALLNANAKERELQDALVASGLLGLTCRAVEEVAIRPANGQHGMRMDIVTSAAEGEPAQVIELKRGCHLLVAHRGKPVERLASGMRAALAQVEAYGRRLQTDADARASVEDGCELRLDVIELRLVAGRRLPAASDYHLVSQREVDSHEAGVPLLIYTWDGLLAELERLVSV
jgi:hypothetical protein